MTMPDVTRTVARTTRLLLRLGYSTPDALQRVLCAARAASAKVSPAGQADPSWLDLLAMESEARLRALTQPQSTRKDGESGHAKTT